MTGALRFVWNATRGSRLRPWRSEYLKWRIETYSGLKADELTPPMIFAFLWRERGNLVRFLKWTNDMEGYRREAHRGHHA